MGTTYLDLTNNVLRRLNENELDSSTFASARGIHGAVKQGVKNAVMRINSQKWEWPFNSSNATKTLTAGTSLYSFPADYKIADWDSFYLVGGTYGSRTITTTRLPPIQRQEWFKFERSNDFDHTSAGVNNPTNIFWNGDGKFGVTPNPDAAYIVAYWYWINTTPLSAYSDTTTVPNNWDWVIERGCLEDMYEFLDNDQRMALGKASFKDAILEMARILIPGNIASVRSTVINFGNSPFFSHGRASNPML